MNKHINILKIMKKEKCEWEKAFMREKERKTLREFLN